jgi:hypothetical protein
MIDFEKQEFTCGKYEGKKISDILWEDESYIWWLINEFEYKQGSFQKKAHALLVSYFEYKN